MRRRWSRWARKQRLASPARYYGDGGTIHNTGHVDVETDATGAVVAVWFRCQMLPFRQTTVDDRRAQQMRANPTNVSLTGVEVHDGGAA